MRYLTAGESHGRGLAGIIEGVPAGLALTAAHIDAQLARRQLGHGRGGRMKIERDRADILSGVRRGETIGSPIALLVWNRDWKNWEKAMRVEPGGGPAPRAVVVPRPGHADLVGGVKYGRPDLRDVLERASARETAMRVALGSVARRLLEEFGVSVASRVVSIAGVEDPTDAARLGAKGLNARADASPVRCLGREAAAAMVAAIDAAAGSGDTVGGVFEVLASGLPVGLGSYAQWDRRLEGLLAHALMSLNGVKGVEAGLGFAGSRRRGSEVHDGFFRDKTRSGIVRRTNRSGGIDGGISTGETLVLRCAMKPIATLLAPLPSVHLKTRKEAKAQVERSDVCAVPAAAVIAESLAALVLADEFLVKFGGDSLAEVRAHHEASKGP
ncbi:MAG: chorismate synthase [Elusimicrobia bacterium]|nr:chorismate synthase [Elusimicrobiota bacterium]